ncbi:LacI family transcriptional regulator [Actinomyces sp. 594]|uniref:LacI family DNA-binding transcriptional regulator n=1 Tax=Actinomyces sp. 594 TaxID=2057793 RepID=UPI001C5970CF|nr:LacI family DNA-binding transcriptional regulator [Actinomyces sp. 594]MBW3070267.1 LacI family transcriptional regulator [Actinomyces sp. 594]
MVVRREPTLADVAEVAGVSLTTVSRVLNNRGYLSQATKDRVARAIDQLNYRPNQVARALHGKSTSIIGVIVPTVALPFFGELAEEIENALAEHQYRMLVCNSMGRADREREYLDLLVSHRVDGIISGAHNDTLAEYQTVRMPLVTVDRDLSPTIPNVRCANEAAARDATRLLLERGARRPALLTSRTGPHNRREAGYRAVLAEAGIEPRIFTVDFHTPDAERARLIDAHLDAAAAQIDAVFATDDLSAAAVLDWAERNGRSVPHDFKVIGFDGTAAVRRALPGLATVQQPIADLARTAVDVLLSQINAHAGGEDAPAAVVSPIELPGLLLAGTTT